MNCPKCLSSETYRKSPLALIVHCNKCHFHWTVNQVLRPFLKTDIYRTKVPKGKHVVSVWCCPKDSSKFSFMIRYGSGVMTFEEFSSNRFLSGCYRTPEEALKAGVEKAYE